jgi:hypothetical protein
LVTGTVAGADTVTVQFFQLESVPEVDTALTEKVKDPATVGVPDIVVLDQEAQVGFVTRERVADSFTVGVYEYAVPILPVVLGLLVNVGAQ